MKNYGKVLLVVFSVLAITLAVVSASAFMLNGLYTPAQTATESEPNGYYPNGVNSGDWGGMMSGGGMMGGGWAPSTSTSTPTSSTTTPVAAAQSSIMPLVGIASLIGAALAGTVGGGYYFAGRRKINLSEHATKTATYSPSANVETPYDSVSKTLKAEERKVVDVLFLHDGEYLQKYIRSETGLSRLKVHRIVTRLSERGIVTLEPSGNTNRVHLSSWLSEKPFSKIRPQEEIAKEMAIQSKME